MDIVIISFDGKYVESAVASLKKYRNKTPINIILQVAQQSIPKNVNDGFKKVSKDCEWFVLWNDDWEATEDGWLDRMLDCATTPENVAFVSPLFMQDDGGIQCGYFISSHGFCGPKYVASEAEAKFGIVDYAHPVLIRTDAFGVLGGYDEIAFKGSQFADMDFIYRASKQGFKTYLAPIKVIHHYANNKSTNAVKLRHRLENEKAFRRKHGFKGTASTLRH